MSVISPTHPPILTAATPREAEAIASADADRLQRDERKASAERWLASLPTRTCVRGRSAEHPHARLVMYRTSASSPEYWENLWLANPSYRMRGYKLPAWYRSVFSRRLPSDGLIVEAGCGNGNLVRMLANEDPQRWGNFVGTGGGGVGGGGATIEGLDFAENAIAENRRIHPEGRYRVGDVRALPYADGSVAAYLSMGVVEHFDENSRRMILGEAARCLRRGGVAIITVPHFNATRRARAALGGFARDGEYGDGLEFYQYCFSPQEIRAQIESTGLSVVEIDGYDARKGFADTLGGERTIARLARSGKRLAALIEQPPRPLRMAFGHMLLMVAVKR